MIFNDTGPLLTRYPTGLHLVIVVGCFVSIGFAAYTALFALHKWTADRAQDCTPLGFGAGAIIVDPLSGDDHQIINFVERGPCELTATIRNAHGVTFQLSYAALSQWSLSPSVQP